MKLRDGILILVLLVVIALQLNKLDNRIKALESQVTVINEILNNDSTFQSWYMKNHVKIAVCEQMALGQLKKIPPRKLLKMVGSCYEK